MSGEKALMEATGVKSYDELADGIKGDISLKEWLWLSDAEKARYIQNATEPEGGFNDPC